MLRNETRNANEPKEATMTRATITPENYMVDPHPTQTPEYWERLARSELASYKAARNDRYTTVEGMRIYRENATRYAGIAAKLRAGTHYVDFYGVLRPITQPPFGRCDACGAQDLHLTRNRNLPPHAGCTNLVPATTEAR